MKSLRDYGHHQLAALRERRKEPEPTLLEAILSGVGFFILVFYFLWSLGA
jgi:hypothetical protein